MCCIFKVVTIKSFKYYAVRRFFVITISAMKNPKKLALAALIALAVAACGSGSANNIAPSGVNPVTLPQTPAARNKSEDVSYGEGVEIYRVGGESCETTGGIGVDIEGNPSKRYNVLLSVASEGRNFANIYRTVVGGESVYEEFDAEQLPAGSYLGTAAVSMADGRTFQDTKPFEVRNCNSEDIIQVYDGADSSLEFITGSKDAESTFIAVNPGHFKGDLLVQLDIYGGGERVLSSSNTSKNGGLVLFDFKTDVSGIYEVEASIRGTVLEGSFEVN